MRKLFTIWTDSLLIWSRNFTLIYVFFMAGLLFTWLFPQVGSSDDSLALGLLLLVLALLMLAMKAGFYSMVALACDRFLGRPRDQVLREASPLDALTLFKAFLPGVSQFLLPLVGGALIYVVMAVLLLVLPMATVFMKYGPLLNKIAQMLPEQKLMALQTLRLAPQDEATLSVIMLAGLLVLLLFGLMTSLWPAFVVYYRNNPLKAFYRSIMQFFKDPISMLGLYFLLLVLWFSVGLLLLLGASSQNTILGAFSALVAMLVQVFIAVLVFTYVYQVVGKPLPMPEEKPAPKVEDSSRSDTHDPFE